MNTNRYAIAVFATLLASVSVATIAGQSQSKEIRTVEVDDVVPAGGVPELFKAAQIVVRGRVLGSRQTAWKHPAVSEVIPQIEHRIRIVEVFKGDAGQLQGKEVTVEQEAGEAENAGRIYRVEGVKALQTGEVYVLFLEKSADSDSYVLKGGTSAAYLLSNGRATPQKRSALQAGTEAELIRLLRSSGAR